MATKHIISPGIGFTPGSIKYIVTRGMTSAAVTAVIGQSKQALVVPFRDKRLLVPFRKRWIVAK